ncbi:MULTISPECIES: SPOR domain-containing protein [Sphingomonas]|uniref:SPOR domain-containing protein n=1 Tax=Sphingomonas TaxID=13687 RepID=UPI000DEED65A|nr:MULTISPECIES: SPOR domain-containing protein [Sphingomonas]
MFWLAAALLVVAEPAPGASVEDGIAAAAQGDNARAIAIWTPLAKSGDAEANYRLAEAYQTGRGVPVNILRARQLYGRAAKECHAPAQASLALLDISSGRKASALKLLRAASANNEPRALLFYGLALFNGDGVPLERERGYAMVKRSVALGLVDAEQTLSEMDVVMFVTPPERARTNLAPGALPAPKLAQSSPKRPTTAQPPVVTPSPTTRGRPAPPPPSAAAAAPAGGGDWRIQLGAFRRPGAPQELWGRISARLPGRQPFLPTQNGLTALQVGSFATRGEAQDACRAAGTSPCVVIRVR